MDKKPLFPQTTTDDIREVVHQTLVQWSENFEPILIQERDKILTRKEAAKFLGISLPTLHDYTQKGYLLAHRIGTRIRYKRSELMNALQGVNVNPKTSL